MNREGGGGREGERGGKEGGGETETDRVGGVEGGGERETERQRQTDKVLGY